MLDASGKTEYTYDMNSRLDDVTYPGPSSVDFNYDWVGNRVNPPADPNGLVFNAADQLTRWPGQHQYEYDLNGNLEYQYDDANPRQLQKTYAYTGANLLQSVTHAGVPTPSTMIWDADSNRVGFTSSTGGSYTFVYDTTAGIPAVIEEYDGSVSVYYVREPGGELLARLGSEGVRYYHFDDLGSTRLLTDGSGNVTDIYAYDAWGNLTARTGTTDQPYQYVGRFGYYTHWQDPALSDALQLGVRSYEPGVGRFGQVDVLREGMSAYLYVSGRPTAWIDPLGLQAEDPEDEEKYRQCVSKATKKFNECVAKTFGTTDIAGGVLGCLAGCAIASAWNGEITWPVCAVACSIGAGCYTAYTLVRTYFKCVVPYRREMRRCERIRDGQSYNGHVPVTGKESLAGCGH